MKKMIEHHIPKICLVCAHANCPSDPTKDIYCKVHETKFDDHYTCEHWKCVQGVPEVVIIPKGDYGN